MTHSVQQRDFYGTHDHTQLRPLRNSYYAHKIVTRLASELGMRREHRVLEIGAGFGRFTLPLLGFCSSVVAVDVSQMGLDSLARRRDARGIPVERCQLHRADANELSREDFLERFDFILGFFFLHRLSDFTRTIARLSPLLGPQGRMAFLEPNPLSPLSVPQVAFCQDLTWREERGIFGLSRRDVETAFRGASLLPQRTKRFGFFPPQVLNRFPSARRVESRLENVRALNRLLPLLLLHARVRDTG